MKENNNQNIIIQLTEFFSLLQLSIEKSEFIKLTLSKPVLSNNELENIYIRYIQIKSDYYLSFNYRYKTKDITKNYSINESIELIKNELGTSFLNADLILTNQTISLKYTKKGEVYLTKTKNNIIENTKIQHDKQKKRFIQTEKKYLQLLGITDVNKKVFPSMQDKYKQINKFVEIVDRLISDSELPEAITICDMGAGKGYLTFAIYDYLNSQLNKQAKVIGVEQRDDLVKLCNNIAQQVNFDKFSFVQGTIQNFQIDKTDILIALHACDTATDDAIFKGISTQAGIIICAPCCHKQIRLQMNSNTTFKSILKHGILEERMAEMVTDAIRALILEANGYKTKVFEFISLEHTGKKL